MYAFDNTSATFAPASHFTFTAQRQTHQTASNSSVAYTPVMDDAYLSSAGLRSTDSLLLAAEIGLSTASLRQSSTASASSTALLKRKGSFSTDLLSFKVNSASTAALQSRQKLSTCEEQAASPVASMADLTLSPFMKSLQLPGTPHSATLQQPMSFTQQLNVTMPSTGQFGSVSNLLDFSGLMSAGISDTQQNNGGMPPWKQSEHTDHMQQSPLPFNRDFYSNNNCDIANDLIMTPQLPELNHTRHPQQQQLSYQHFQSNSISNKKRALDDENTVPIPSPPQSAANSRALFSTTTLNNVEWTASEDQLLLQAAKYGGGDWTRAVGELLPHRTSQQCWSRWTELANNTATTRGHSTSRATDNNNSNNNHSNNNHKRRRTTGWTKEEDQLLMDTYRLFPKQWARIALVMPGRTNHQVKQRWSYVLDSDIRNGPWTAAEDDLLRAGYDQFGTHWAKIATTIAGRTNIQCRNRWKDVLDPGIKHGQWTVAEDEALDRAYATHGNKWSRVCMEVPGRTGLQCRDRYTRNHERRHRADE